MKFDSPNIKEYVRSFQYGEEKGFTYFFNALYPKLYFYASRLVGDHQTAEDLVEDSFIKVWEKHTIFSNENVLKSYLYQTVRNTCLNYLQAQKKARDKDADLHAYLQADSTTEPIVNDIIRAEVVGELYAAMTKLPPAMQRVFKMLYIEGKTVREIAEELQLSIHTIKNQKAKGLVIIRGFMSRTSFWIFMAYYADRIQN